MMVQYDNTGADIWIGFVELQNKKEREINNKRMEETKSE